MAGGGGELGFDDQMVWNVAPAHRVLYSWTTAEQIAELRRDRALLTRSERPGMGPGYAFTRMLQLAALGDTPSHQLLGKLAGESFVKARYAWPHPWATRMGWPGEQYGSELIRIVLKPEAWTVVVSDVGAMSVIDGNNQRVATEEALLHVERIGAIFFFRTTVEGRGSFHQCSGGYREFIVGNPAMIEQWSIGTAEIHARIEEDAARFDGFVETVRESMYTPGPAEFNEEVACHWDAPPGDGDEWMYRRSLAIPSTHYLPRPPEIARIATTLRDSLFELDPLVVMPGG